MHGIQSWGEGLRLLLELTATLAFALSGLMEAARKRLDAVGVCVVAFLAAFGGGTLRDVLLADPGVVAHLQKDARDRLRTRFNDQRLTADAVTEVTVSSSLPLLNQVVTMDAARFHAGRDALLTGAWQTTNTGAEAVPFSAVVGAKPQAPLPPLGGDLSGDTLISAERALELMCRRVTDRVAFGRPLAEQGVIREWIADSRMEIEQARLLTFKAAWLMDTVGNKGAAVEISSIKVVVPNMALRVVDRSIQAHGGGGVSDDFPLARMYAGLRTLRFADGPDEVHRRQVARTELGRYS